MKINAEPRKGMLKSEKGFVLVLALVSMFAMSIIGISLIMNMTTDVQLARNEREGKLAFQLADAGINEAIARFKLDAATNARYVGEPSGTTGYRTTATVLLNPAFPSMDGLNYNVAVSYLTEGTPYCDSNAAAASCSSFCCSANA